MEFIAERILKGICSDGREIDVILGLGVPFNEAIGEKSTGEWSCLVKIEGVLRSTTKIYGRDSWQALHLASGFIENMLLNFLEKEGRLFQHDKALSAGELRAEVFFERR